MQQDANQKLQHMRDTLKVAWTATVSQPAACARAPQANSANPGGVVMNSVPGTSHERLQQQLQQHLQQQHLQQPQKPQWSLLQPQQHRKQEQNRQDLLFAQAAQAGKELAQAAKAMQGKKRKLSQLQTNEDALPPLMVPQSHEL